MDLLICRYWHRKVSDPRLYPERHKGFPNLFFACPIPMNTVQGKCIYLLSRCTQRDQAVCNTEHHREKKKTCVHRTECSPLESNIICHTMLSRKTEINLHRLKGRIKTHPPLLSRRSVQGPLCIPEPSSSWLFLHNICQNTLTFKHLSVTYTIVQ